MTQKEKAKAYDEAIIKAKELYNQGLINPPLEHIFPELKESESGKIRKTLIDYFKNYKTQEEIGIKTFFGIPTDNILAWLEKQGEQKELSQSKVTKKSDQDWSEEDERNLKGIIDEIEANKNDAPDYDLATYDRFLFWLKSLKQRMQ